LTRPCGRSSTSWTSAIRPSRTRCRATRSPSRLVSSASAAAASGAHASNENRTPIYYKKLVFISYFNAGVRAVDIRDPYHPQEAAYYIPATTSDTDVRCRDNDIPATCKVVIQTNNVEVDDRGLVYIVNGANTGLHILELDGRTRDTFLGR
jgi:hypothetical protein